LRAKVGARHDSFTATASSLPAGPYISALHTAPSTLKFRLLDSGASHHITGDKSLFRGFVRSACVPVGGIGGTLHATGVGRGVLTVHGHDIPLRRLYYVPGLPTSLISVSELVEANYGFSFNKVNAVSGVTVTPPTPFSPFFLPCHSGLYPAPATSSSTSHEALFEHDTEPANVRGFVSVGGKQVGNTHVGSLTLGALLHKRLGHASWANGHFRRENARLVWPVCLQVQMQCCLRGVQQGKNEGALFTLCSFPPCAPTP
jgi:hypothetical protein